MLQVNHENSNIVDDGPDNNTINIEIASMPDPEDVFSTTLGAADTSRSYIRVPNIRDGNGDIIFPYEYEAKLHDGSIVVVNVSLKLFVLSPYSPSNFTINHWHLPNRWNLRPNLRSDSSFKKKKEQDENGAHIYQLILNSMQLLPIADIQQITRNHGEDSKVVEKRKPVEEIQPTSPQKKKTTRTAKPSTTKIPNLRGSVGGLSKNNSKLSNDAMDVM